ncbi:PHP domain-containing protein [Acidaminobacter sp. JC074]|uniref:PHP domain-containing protein n=1 Tax=Acidaminobacter sp. JC074 TaxID=2530199 RepID=UPI001F0DBCD9|nr:PHP domain-containing protein [Acidaminobacter sp. JC074]MCH4887757.1 PHP domain-containing protein [Acidaminobacter sp. JC074]
MKVDLHMHSYHSDGKLTCKALVEEVMDAGIGLFSLTDHDTINGLEEMKEAVKGQNLSFIPGVEIATAYQGKEYHLTVYGYDASDETFKSLIDASIKIRSDYDKAIVKFMEPKVSLEEFLDYEDDPFIGGWPSLNFFKKKGLVKDIYDYFEISDKCPARMVFPEPKEVIEAAHAAGAGVFMAHPSSNGKGGLPVEILDYFRLQGLDGLECYSPYTESDREVDYYLDYCKKYDLKISGGSDYHGGFVGRQLGFPHVTSDQISYDYLKEFVWKE